MQQRPSSGQKALERLDIFCPDLILLDMMMPDVDGIEVCRRLRAIPKWQVVPVIMVTALNSKDDLARCLKAGANDFISKPISGVELRARVASMLRIKQQYDQLQTLLQLREDMVNMIVHDLRNPLTSIVLSTEILKLQTLSPEQQQAKLNQIAIAGYQLQSLVDSLLLMAKLESGRMILNYSEIDLCALCTSAIADLEAIATQKKLQLRSHLPAPGGSIWVDATLVRRVLDNLLSNAIKFSPTGSDIILQAEYRETGGAILSDYRLWPRHQ